MTGLLMNWQGPAKASVPLLVLVSEYITVRITVSTSLTLNPLVPISAGIGIVPHDPVYFVF